MSEKQSFSSETINEAKKLSYTLDEKLFEGREKVNGFTVDSPSSKDLDDALALEKTKEGWILHVSIADVSALVKPESYIDKDAFEKVFTRYLKNGNEPMIPHVLSENMLSLLENEKRPTLTFSIPISKDFEIGDPQISKTYIQSQKRFSYNEVDQLLRNKQENKWKGDLQELSYVAQNLAKRRKGSGSHKDGSKSHTIVQESMLLANESLAQFCDKNDIPILFRNQSNGEKKPKQVVFQEKGKPQKNFFQYIKTSFRNTMLRVVDFCEKHNIPVFPQKYFEKIRKLSKKEFLLEVRNSAQNPEEENASTIQKAVHDVIQPAEYGIESEGHAGLETSAYTHATSPIRRYADLINHRIFSTLADNANDPEETKKHLPYSEKELQEIAYQINTVTKKEKEGQKKKKKK